MARPAAILAAAAFVLSSSAALAQPGPLESVTATRVGAGHVQLDVTFMAGGCEALDPPAVEAVDNETNAVFLAVVSTADICTMQLVPLTYSGVIPVEPQAEAIVVTVLGPDGQPRATGSVVIGP